jgi:hypothetical protein
MHRQAETSHASQDLFRVLARRKVFNTKITAFLFVRQELGELTSKERLGISFHTEECRDLPYTRQIKLLKNKSSKT